LCNCARAAQIVIWPETPFCGPIPDDNDFVAVAAGKMHFLALRADGSLWACGHNGYGQTDVPDGNFVAIAACSYHNLAIRDEGNLAAWGSNWDEPPSGNDYIGIAAGALHNLALRSDGSLVSWGSNDHNQVSDTPTDKPYTKIACGYMFSVAIKADGTLKAWGWNDLGACDIPDGNNFVDISCGVNHALARTADQQLIAWGQNACGQCDVPDGNYLAATGGSNHSLAIANDGSLVNISDCDTNEPPSGTGFVAVAADEEPSNIILTCDKWVTLTIENEPDTLNGTIPTVGRHSYYQGQNVSITAARATDCPAVYDFHHWSGDIPDPCAASQYIIMDANTAITAHYTRDEAECGDECHPIHDAYDRNRDCYVNMLDFAVFAGEWGCTHPDCD
jgi:alpha-tubulin suppressor-like RCC1 family protein